MLFTKVHQIRKGLRHVPHGHIAWDVDHTLGGEMFYIWGEVITIDRSGPAPQQRCSVFYTRARHGPMQWPLRQRGGGFKDHRHAARQQRVEEPFPRGKVTTWRREKAKKTVPTTFSQVD